MFFWSPTAAARALEALYDDIAPEFARTRSKAWAELRLLFRSTPEKARILDLGCGNGRLVPLFREKNCHVSGVDISAKLLDIARRGYPEADFYQADFRKLPFVRETFGEAWSVASFHHLPTVRARREALEEIWRVLKKDGSLVLTVWNLWRLPRYEHAKRLASWRALIFPGWTRRDFLIPWGQGKKPRYYHAFGPAELISLARQSGFSLVEWWGAREGVKIAEEEAENLCFRFRKST